VQSEIFRIKFPIFPKAGCSARQITIVRSAKVLGKSNVKPIVMRDPDLWNDYSSVIASCIGKIARLDIATDSRKQSCEWRSQNFEREMVGDTRAQVPEYRNGGSYDRQIIVWGCREADASEMVRAGVSLPALMTLLGHVRAEMTMKYVLVAGDDLQREFHLARSQPQHLVPLPKASTNFASPRIGRCCRFFSLRSTRHRDVPAIPTRRFSTIPPRSPLQSPQQDSR
jgi:hypothetical protein